MTGYGVCTKFVITIYPKTFNRNYSFIKNKIETKVIIGAIHGRMSVLDDH